MSIRATFHYFQGMECDMYSFCMQYSPKLLCCYRVNILKNLLRSKGAGAVDLR